DLNRTADHDTFRNLEIGGIRIDAGNVGGSGHVIFGTTTGSGTLVRVNVEDVYLHDITASNIPVSQSESTFRTGVGISIYQLAANESVQNHASSIRCERVQISGGNVGIEVVGRGPSTVTTDLNALI